MPALEYLSAGEAGTSRAEAIAGLYASLGAANKGKQRHARPLPPRRLLAVAARPARPAGRRLPHSGFCNNAYPSSGDALDPQPFTGDYPRIIECTVPPRSRPTESCK